MSSKAIQERTNSFDDKRIGQTLLSYAVPCVLLLIFATVMFVKTENPRGLIRAGVQWMEVGSVAVVMTAIIITGGIDLSVGSMVALCSVCIGVLWEDGQLSIQMASVCAVAVGLAAGLLNGLLVVVGLSPLIVTLATMAFYSGLALALSNAEPIGFTNELVMAMEDANLLFGYPLKYYFFLIVLVLGYLLLHRCRIGRACFYIGENMEAARYSAISIEKAQFVLYGLSGLVAGIVAVLNTMYKLNANPVAHEGMELHVIACVVVGGTLITGGHGSIGRTLLGLLVVASLDIGLNFLSSDFSWLNPQVRLILTGCLVVAVAIWNQKVRN